MDSRIFPNSAFGIHLGEAHIIRNVGGSARAALRELVVSQQMLGTREVMVVKHTSPLPPQFYVPRPGVSDDLRLWRRKVHKRFPRQNDPGEPRRLARGDV